MLNENKIGLNYSDVYLIPNYGIAKTRQDCYTAIKLGNHVFGIPVIPANMKSIVDISTCKFLARKGIFYIMHRFDVDVVDFCNEMRNNKLYTSISVGVSKKSRTDLTRLYTWNIIPDYITLDIAHAHSINAAEMITFIKRIFPKSFLIAGNVATSEGVKFLAKCGANAVKVGISNGAACTTKDATGFIVPQFTSVLDASRKAPVPIIADGGIKTIGDISKALVAGASMIMAGGLFAGYDENPKFTKTKDGKCVYFGSASEENKGEHSYVEGKQLIVEPRGSMSVLLDDIGAGLRSAISYAGGKNLKAFNNVKWGVVHK
jgi:GMP reductase